MRVVAYVSLLILVGMTAGCVTETTRGPFQKAEPDEVAESQIQLGVGYIRNGNYQRAKESLQKALEIEPRSAVAHNYFGLLYQLELDAELAEEHYRKAVRYDPDLAAARNNYGAFLFEQGRYKEAVEQLQVAAEDRVYRYRPQVYENLGVGYLQLDDREAATQAFRKAIALNPGQSRALLELAQIRFEQQRYSASRELLSQHRKVSRQSPRSLWLGIRLARIFGDEDEEASLALALKNIFPGSPQYEAYKRSVSE